MLDPDNLLTTSGFSVMLPARQVMVDYGGQV
jgi:hypothetical protein